MKFLTHSILTLAIIISGVIPSYAADLLKPKREMRSAWVATVWKLDWPQTVISETGNKSQIDRQKKDMITLLDSMAVNNMNAINFQVRDRSDAFYKSSYEPWSADLVAERGLDPGYDPLQFVVEECHKRGLECHAWVNPYRYESVVGQWSGLPGDYRKDHPDWVMDQGGASILNPGHPGVIQRIVDICKEIITNYDVDGILYDDYFYLSGTPMSADADLYEKYTEDGGTLSQADWRRDNVNRMLKAVHDMIQEVKPWVRFGVSPAGVAASSQTVADKYGVTPCPGSDWQYNDIYSDPLAWISQKSLDFISPQIYWTIGHSTDYAKVAPWWSMVANKFNRHFYSSHSISSLNSSSKSILETSEYSANGVSSLERSLMNEPKASGPNNTTFKEYADEIKVNRESTLNDAPGSIFYSCKYMYRTAPLFAHYLKTTVFSKPAILPVMSYKPGNNPGIVKNLTRNGNTLSWDEYDNVRYTVYAVPDNVQQNSFNHDVGYLLGTSYAASYEIPEALASGYQYAICVLDRIGYEYTPVFLGAEVKTLQAPVIIAPENGSTVLDPFEFTWDPVENAQSYTVEIASDKDFNNLMYTVPSNTEKLSSAVLENLQSETKYFWRVRSSAANCEDGVSSVFEFTPKILSITYPQDNQSGVSTTLQITWSSMPGNIGVLEIATDRNFNETDIILSVESDEGSYQVGEFTLKAMTRYYARVTLINGDASKTTEPISFTTEEMIATPPVITYPKEGANFYSEDKITLERQKAANSFTIEVAETTTFPRGKYTVTLTNFNFQSAKGGDIKVSSKNLVENTTYYVRAVASYLTSEGGKKTEYSDIRSFVYAGQGSGVEDNLSGVSVKIIGGAYNPVLEISAPVNTKIQAKLFNSVGALQDILFDGNTDGNIEIPLSHLSQGMYIISTTMNGTSKTLKFIK